ncbi:Probable type I modification methyltransferase, subunit S [Flavobacterium indicum GPTSA100-9 = DSM 17447]|uniref:Probable type I modification methyltransferase, subunit S n=1 Tax=Flavobacterium indicum (strain DSM 17447 / CIP 109464 / GPTSA100-9) TaxID=1094466 RepID=H8XSS5_FLAIG|nr:restriction endonuclease subunit S [Flavobacterium indicum]CCG53467.1 Probable type I modification methyltransferase, subunit S [Flavobacterium indicum GPTSA100-9 = DSM 17447]
MNKNKTWQTKKLGEVCSIQTGKYDANHSKPNGKYRFYTCAFDYLYCDTNRFKGECIILPGNGANVGEVFYYNGEFDAYQRTYVLNEIKTNAKYLFYHLYGNWKTRNKDKQFGSATNYIRMANFTDYEIPVPPLEIQHAIVSKIEELFSELDQGLADLKTAQAQLKVYRQSVLNLLATNENLTPIEKIISKLDQGWSPKCENNASVDKTQWAVIKTSAVQKGYFVEIENKILPNNLIPKEQHEIEVGDILITRAGPRVRVGICCMVKHTRPKLINCDKVYRIKVNKELILPEYFEYIINTPKYQDIIEKMKSGISDSGLNLTQKVFVNITIPLPPIEEQHLIVQEIESRLSVADKMEESILESLQKAEALRQSILKKAFSGELI